LPTDTLQREEESAIRKASAYMLGSSAYHALMVCRAKDQRKDSAANRQCLFSGLSQKACTPPTC
jgi:hypothetical protein